MTLAPSYTAPGRRAFIQRRLGASRSALECIALARVIHQDAPQASFTKAVACRVGRFAQRGGNARPNAATHCKQVA